MILRQLVRRFSKAMVEAKLDAIPVVDIDDAGRFKYILIKVYGPEKSDGTEPSKLIVRGYKRAQWHGRRATITFRNEKKFWLRLFVSL